MSSTFNKKLLIMALYAGEIMLKSGAEAYRVEDTIYRLCHSRKFRYIDSYVTPTGIFVTIDNEGERTEDITSYIKRINTRSINLNKVAKVNDFSRKFVQGEMTIEEAMKTLKEIDAIEPYSTLVHALCGGIASAFVSILFGANIYEFAAALLTSIIVTFVVKSLYKIYFPPFLTNISGGVVAALGAILTSYISVNVNVDVVIVGAIMVMVPGVAITNAVRDSITGDLVSGLAKGIEALIIATSIAFGVGFVLQVWILITGGQLI
ncbi:threonine/serine exporter family protein [Serpentinicella sp. ANB-PHB4]|uniref:threonine/serine exporter family protein n=1 Tax=Serpentinicella sp. ANB-PHB4 TaxID=3074076 RepID=UPI00285D295E|nr:threonine/serine exporter family protein [Serpentinicella sp. ANB-PHB4]MDR5658078.1 threonine/serine exporter family protein [Serpentinicella sp. ANB-PHB4]